MTIPQIIVTCLVSFSTVLSILVFIITPKRDYPIAHNTGLIHAIMYLIAGIILFLL
jgi:hypothetical protein